MEDSKQERGSATLHFSRYRSGPTAGFFDPATDIRKIVPEIFALILQESEDAGDEYLEDFRYIHECVRIFQIRILEDPTPIDRQVSLFQEAIGKARPTAVERWMSRFVFSMACVYSLFCRRDSAADSNALHGMLDLTRYASLGRLLSADVVERIDAELKPGASLLANSRLDRTGGVLVCHETGEEIRHVQDIAAKFISATGDQSWEAKAAACDAEFNRGPGVHSGAERLALSLAYPTYRNPGLTVEIDREDLGDGLPA